MELDLGVPEGREAGFRHPAIVITAQRILDAQPTVVHVVPLTTTLRSFSSAVTIDPDGTNGLRVPSAARCQQIRAVSTSRIQHVRGNVGSVPLRQMRETIGLILDIAV